jgi:hypothetical protein
MVPKVQNMRKCPDQIFFNYLGESTTYHIFAIPKKQRPVGQGVKTPPFHGGITSSNLVRATRRLTQDLSRPFFIAFNVQSCR